MNHITKNTAGALLALLTGYACCSCTFAQPENSPPPSRQVVDLEILLPNETDLPGIFYLTPNDKGANAKPIQDRGKIQIPDGFKLGYFNDRSELRAETLRSELARLPVKEIHLAGRTITEDTVDALQGIDLETVELDFPDETTLTDRIGKTLAKSPSLRTIYLSQGRVASADFYTALSALPCAHLHLSFLEGTPAPANWLGSFSALDRFHALSTPVMTDQSLTGKATSPLTELILNGCDNIGQELSSAVASYRNLQVLRLSYLSLSAADVRTWRLSTLQTLSFEGCEGITAEDIAKITYPKLKQLELSYVNRGFKTLFTALAGHKSIEELVISRSETLHDTTIECLNAPSSLRKLAFKSSDGFTGKHLAAFLSGSNLEMLELEGLKLNTDEISQAVTKAKLKSLSLHGCTTIEDRVLDAIKDSATLESLDVGGCDRFSANTVEYLCKIKGLRKLDIGHFEWLTDDHLAKMAENLAHLDSLVLVSSPLVTDKGVGALAKTNISRLTLRHLAINDASLKLLIQAKKLAWLDLTGSQGISSASIKAFQESRSDITIKAPTS